jgi:hypothetical protein
MEAPFMKLVGLISAAVLILAFGATAPAYAQEQRDQQEEKKAQPEEKKSKAQPQEKRAQPEEKKAQSDKPSGQHEKNAETQKNSRPEQKSAPQHAQQSKGGQPEQHAENNRGGGRIPDDRFKANFGREHSFHVSRGDYDNHRFQYGGYNFEFVDAWPSNWLYTQDVYVVEINGVYYLCNPSYPGVNVTLGFSL